MIATKREELGLSQKDLAKKIDTPTWYVKKLEDKNVVLVPKISTLCRISEALRMSPRKLIEKMIDDEE